MAIKFKFEINDIEVKQDGADNSKGVLKLRVRSNYLVGRHGADHTTDIAGGTPIKDKTSPATTKQLNQFAFIEITCAKEVAAQAARLIKFRDTLKSGTEDEGKWIIILNDVDAGGTNDTLPTGGTANDTITLKEADFGGTFDLTKIEIGAPNVTADAFNITTPWTAERTAWKKLEDDLKAIEGRYTLNSNLQTTDIAADITLLNAYWVANAVAGAPVSAEKKLYELDNVKIIDDAGTGANDGQYYKKKIDWWIQILSELEIWKAGGFDNVEEVLKANADGFIIDARDGAAGTNSPAAIGITKSNKGSGLIEKQTDGTSARANVQANRDKIKSLIKDKKFGGWPMFDAGQAVDAAVADESKKLFGTGYAAATTLNPTAERLITFYGDNWFGVERDSVNYLNLDASDPKNFRGFKPTDMEGTGGNAYGGHGEDMSDDDGIDTGKRVTKIAKDIWYAPSLEEAIDLAFFGKHYFVADPSVLTDPTADKNTKRLDERYKSGDNKCLLYFDEVDGLTAKNTLDLYYAALKHQNCGDSVYNKTDNKLVGGARWDNSTDPKKCNWHSNATGGAGNARDIVDKAYGVVSAFLTEWANYAVKDYSTKNKNNDKTELESDKAALETLKNYKNDNDNNKKKLGERWEKKIQQKIAAIEAVLTGGPGPGGPPPPTKKFSQADELNNLITAATDGSDKKKVYQAFQGLDDTDAKKTDAVFDALKTLIGKLDGTIDKPSELEALSTGGDNKTAWDFVNENTKDSSGKGWAERTLQKAKADLTSAIAAAKNEMSGESEAVAKTRIESVESIQEAKDIGALFKLCKEAHNTIMQERAVALKSEIEAYSKGSGSKKAAWDKVEKYQKESGKGFGTSALEKTAQRNEKGKKGFDRLAQEKTAAAVRTAWEAKKDDVDEEDMKRIQVVVTLRELTGADKTNEVTELYNLLNKNSLDVYKDDNDADLERIGKDIAKIREYINASDTDPKGLVQKKIDALDTKFGTAKAFLENWVKKLESRQTTLKQKSEQRKKQNKDDNNEDQTPNKESFWRSGWGITLIILGVLVVVGAIAYFIKTNSSEEGEGE